MCRVNSYSAKQMLTGIKKLCRGDKNIQTEKNKDKTKNCQEDVSPISTLFILTKLIPRFVTDTM